MAYVEPNSTIQIFKNVPLDNSYRNTYWFTSINAQDDFFGVTNYVNFYGITFPENSYTRKERGYVRLNIAPDTIIAYNYMRYRNINHANKWYYAFILDVEYVNENTAEITFELDYIQTYMFDVTIHDSFVERQHNLTDNVGDNIIEEKLGTGTDYKVEKHGTIIKLTPDRMMFYVAKAVNFSGGSPLSPVTENPKFSVVNNYGGKVCIEIFKLPESDTEAQTLSNDLAVAFANISDDNIVATFAYNHVLDNLVGGFATQQARYAGNFLNIDGTQEPLYSNASYEQNISSVSIGLTLEDKVDNYVPKNKKLLTYPYKYINVESGEGTSIDLKFEMFSNNTYNFVLYGSLFPRPMYVLYPKNYATSIDPDLHTNPYPTGYEYGIPISTDVSIPFSTDAFKAHLLATQGSRYYSISKELIEMSGMVSTFGAMGMVAQNRGANGAFKKGVNVLGTPISGKTIAEGRNTLYKKGVESAWDLAEDYRNVGMVLADILNAKGFANGAKGNFDSNGILIGTDRYAYEYNVITIRREYAEIIDSYFTMYGYAQKKLMPVLSPSSDSVATKNARRPHFNYTKTVGCNVFVTANSSVNGCPAGDLKNISKIYDNGITFWNPADTVGDYSLNNAPVTP